MCKAGLFAGRLDVLQVAITAWKRWSMTFTFGDWMPWYDSKLSSSTLVKNHKTFLLCLLAVGTHFVLRHLGNRSPVMVGVERARAVLSTAGIDDRATWMTERVDIVDALADHNVSPAKEVCVTVGVRAHQTHGRNSQERDGASSNEEGRKAMTMSPKGAIHAVRLTNVLGLNGGSAHSGASRRRWGLGGLLGLGWPLLLPSLLLTLPLHQLPSHRRLDQHGHDQKGGEKQ